MELEKARVEAVVPLIFVARRRLFDFSFRARRVSWPAPWLFSHDIFIIIFKALAHQVCDYLIREHTSVETPHHCQHIRVFTCALLLFEVGLSTPGSWFRGFGRFPFCADRFILSTLVWATFRHFHLFIFSTFKKGMLAFLTVCRYIAALFGVDTVDSGPEAIWFEFI